MLFRTVLAKAIAKLPIMTSWHCSVVGEALSGEAPYLRRVNLDITGFGLRLGNAHYCCGRVASPHPNCGAGFTCSWHELGIAFVPNLRDVGGYTTRDESVVIDHPMRV